MHDVREVFLDDIDPHGIFRLVAHAEESTINLNKIGTLVDLFAAFNTNGEPLPTNWPEEDRGMLHDIAEMRRLHELCKLKQ